MCVTYFLLLQHHMQSAYGDLDEFFGGEELLAFNYQGEVLQDANNFQEPPRLDAGHVMKVELPFG